MVTLRSTVEPLYEIKVDSRVLEAAGAPRCPWEEIMEVVPAPSKRAAAQPAEAAATGAEHDAVTA